MRRRPVGVAIVLTLLVTAAGTPLHANDRDARAPGPRAEPQPEPALRAATPTTIRAAIATLGRVRLHPGRDALEVGQTAPARERAPRE